MATIEREPDRNARIADESALLRQMAELVDEMSVDNIETESAVSDIASCMRLLAEAWPSIDCSTRTREGDSTPSQSGFETNLPDFSFTGDRFEIQSMLGHGGFGVVLLAIDKRLQREVALKIPRPEILISHNMRGRFLREAQAAAALDHPNIVPIFDTGEIGPIWFITSRYVAGPTLAEWLRENVDISSRQAADLIATLALAVQHAHSRGVLHRDLKPANVLLEPIVAGSETSFPFAPRVSDFGLARRLDEDGKFSAQESFVGTPRYMAPEQAACRHEDVGTHTDVFALGVILYELLTGAVPYAAENEAETLHKIQHDPVPVSPLQRRRVPQDLQAICLKCLHKSPAQRYETAGAVATDLRRFLNNEPISARATSRAERIVRWCQRRPVQAGLLATLCFVAGVGVVGITWQWQRAQRGLAIAKEQTARAEENLRHLELAFVDLAWVFDEAELWSSSDHDFSVLLEDKLRRYADEMFPQYLTDDQVPKSIAAAVYAINAKSSSLNGQADRAEQHYRKSIELWRAELHDNPDRAEISRALGITLFGYASHLVKTRTAQSDDPDFHLVQQMFATLVLPAEDELKALETYAHLMANFGHARARRGHNEAALKAFQLANQIWHELCQRSNTPSYRVMEATTLSILAARQHRSRRDFSGALSKTTEARQLLEEAVASEPTRLDWQFLLSKTLREEAFFTQRSGNEIASQPLYERSINSYRDLLKAEPKDSPHRLPYGDTCREYADLLAEIGQPGKSLRYYQLCTDTWNALRELNTLSTDELGRLAMVYANAADVDADLGQSEAAILQFRKSIEVASELHKNPGTPRKAFAALIHSNLKLGELLRRDRQFSAAIPYLRNAVDLLIQQVEIRPNNLNFNQQLETARARLKLAVESNADLPAGL
jgi:tetratricopeptide (TPR) repeat protein